MHKFEDTPEEPPVKRIYRLYAEMEQKTLLFEGAICESFEEMKESFRLSHNQSWDEMYPDGVWTVEWMKEDD